MQGHMAATSSTPANTSAPQSETERTRPTLRSPFIAHSLVPAVTVHLDVRPIPEGSNDIQCFQCGGTVQQSRLAAHLRSRHPALSLSGPMMAQFGLTPCPQCRQLFSASRGLAAHLRTCGRGPVDEGMIFLTPDAQHVPAPHLAATQVIHHGVLSEAPVMGAAPARRTSGHVSRSLSTHADPSAPQDLFSDFPAVGRSSSEVLLADLHQDGCDREVAEEHRHPGQEPCNDCDAPRDDSQLHQVLTQIIRHEGDLETEPFLGVTGSRPLSGENYQESVSVLPPVIPPVQQPAVGVLQTTHSTSVPAITSAPRQPSSAYLQYFLAQEPCMNCDEPGIPWPCCGSANVCLQCTRQARNAAVRSYNFPNPRCPNCRVDYPRDENFTLLFCRVCTQPTEALPDFTTRSTDDVGRVSCTHRQPAFRDIDDIWDSLTCCGGRVHRACLPMLTERGRCPVCTDDFCSECHLGCNQENCRPRPRGQPGHEDTIYDRCQNPPLFNRECGHAACVLHRDIQECSVCRGLLSVRLEPAGAPAANLLTPPDSPAHSDGDYPVYRDGAFPYGQGELLVCACGGVRTPFECDVCGPRPVPQGALDVHVTDLFSTLHEDYPFFVDAMVGHAHGALNSQSRISSICPACGTAVSKVNPDSPACDALMCTMCQTHFCFYCEARVLDNYRLPGHGPHYMTHVFSDRPVAVGNGWCQLRRQPSVPNSVRPPNQTPQEVQVVGATVSLGGSGHTEPFTEESLPPASSARVQTSTGVAPAPREMTSDPIDPSLLGSAVPTDTPVSFIHPDVLQSAAFSFVPGALPVLAAVPAPAQPRGPTIVPRPSVDPPVPTTRAHSLSTPQHTRTPSTSARSRLSVTPTRPVATPSRDSRNRPTTPRGIRQQPLVQARPHAGNMGPPLPRPSTAVRSGPPRRAKVLPYVPKNLWALFQDVCRPIFADLERAASCNNMVEMEHLLKELLDVPAHTLSVRRGGRRMESSLASQLRAVTITRVQLPFQHTNGTSDSNADHPQQDSKTDQSGREVKTNQPACETKVNDVDPRAVRRAVGLTLTNHASRATRAIYQDVLPEVTSAIEEQLVQLHPPATDTAIPALPPNAPFVPVLGDDNFIRLWKKRVANGAAPAVSGFTGDHGLPLLEDTHCLRGLSLLIQLIRNGRLSEQCRTHLLSCPVIPTVKHAGGIRPVTIGETFYKMAAVVALNDIEEEAVELLGPDQFALRPGGPESATIALKVALETRTGASTDIQNAFNSLDRGLMLRELFAHPTLAPVWRLAHWVYSQPVDLQLFSSSGVFMRYITAACGPLQGEPFSSFLYCLTTKPLIDAAKAAGGPDVDVIALTDDVTFIGPPDGVAVTRAVKTYERGTTRLNLRFQPRKSTFISFHGQPLSEELLQYAASQDMKIEFECCIIGGTPMGPHRERVQEEALRIAHKSQRFFTALQHEAMTAPVADRLLRLCGVPRVQFLARVGLFGEYDDALNYFDEEVKQAATLQAGLCDQSGSPQVFTQQAAPLRHAGFAFRAYAHNISLFAAVGAFAGASTILHRLCPNGLPPRMAISIVRTIHAVRERIDERTAARCLPPSTSSANQCLHFYALTEEGKQAAFRLQKTLSMAAAEKLSTTLLEASTPVDAARFFACTAPYASAWLSDPFLARPMTDEAHGAACKLRLNQTISSLTMCHCGHNLQNDPWHILSHKGGGEAGRRHDEIVDRLVDAVHRAGGQAWAEPRQDFWQDRRRTDIFAVMGPKSYHIDVRVTHPTSTSYVTVACQGSLKAAEEAAQEKKRRYAAMAHSDGASFVPFIVETYGGFGKDARAFITDLAKFAATTSRVWSAAETRFMVRAEVQRALFEGNLRVANAVLQESNPIRYASGRCHAVAPRPRRVVPDEAYDADDGITQILPHTASLSEPVMVPVPVPAPGPVTIAPSTEYQPRTPPRRPQLSVLTVSGLEVLAQTQPHSSTRSEVPMQVQPLPPASPPSPLIVLSGQLLLAPPGAPLLPLAERTLSSGRHLSTPSRRTLPHTNSRGLAHSTPPGLRVARTTPHRPHTNSRGWARSTPRGLPVAPRLAGTVRPNRRSTPRGLSVARTTPHRPSLTRTVRPSRHPVSIQPLLPTPTPFQAPPPTTTQHPPQPPPHPPPIPPLQPISQSQQTQSPTTSSQTPTNTNRQSSSTLNPTSSFQNGTQTQISSRTEEKVGPGTSSSRNASRDEALSLLDRIRPTVRSQTTGTSTPNRSRSERGNWRSDGRRTPRTSSREIDRRRGRGAGNGNTNATQVHTTTPSGTSQYR